MLLINCTHVYSVTDTCIQVCYWYPVYTCVNDTQYTRVWCGVLVRTACKQARPSKWICDLSIREIMSNTSKHIHKGPHNIWSYVYRSTREFLCSKGVNVLTTHNMTCPHCRGIHQPRTNKMSGKSIWDARRQLSDYSDRMQAAKQGNMHSIHRKRKELALLRRTVQLWDLSNDLSRGYRIIFLG